MLETEGCRVHRMDVGPGSHADAIATVERVRRLREPWVILDGYHFDADYQKTLKDCDCHLLCLDDNGQVAFYSADLVLNQNLHANESLYKNKEDYTRLLLGPRFSLLRRQFRNRPVVREISQFASRLLVTMGGGDQNNITARVVKAIKRIKEAGYTTKIVIGQANPHLKSLDRAIGQSGGTFTLLKNVTHMADLMAWADMAISGGGSTCWELACMGLPAIVLTTIDNQQPIADRLNKRGIVVGLGRLDDIDDDTLTDSIWKLSKSVEKRQEMSLNGRHLVDGNGVIRTIRVMCNS
jgi:UDP-2,4-diacetamido-2,4,6-trideoxy-beta-L-altropyranose hydrolase